jgi:hypothetical protein
MNRVAQFVRIIVRVRTWIREIHHALQDQTETGHDGNEIERGQNLPRDKIRAVIYFDDETIRTMNAEAEKQHCTQEGIRRATVAAVVAAAIYALISLLIWRQMITQTRISNESLQQVAKSFQTDERAWIGFTFVEGSITFTLQKSFLVPTKLINTGKTPARNVHGNIVVGIFKKGEPLDFTYTKGHAHYFVESGTIFRDGSITESFEAIKHGQDKAEAIIFTGPIKDELFSGRSFLIVHGRVDYWDIFGTEHWTTYCRYVLHPEQISQQCTRYNDTDNNSPN